jgi:hypothetical protein
MAGAATRHLVDPQESLVFARVSIWEDIDPEPLSRIEQRFRAGAVGHFETVPGYQGGMTIVDRDVGRLLTVGLYATEDSARAADPTVGSNSAEGFAHDVGELLGAARRTIALIGEVVQEGA